ncbi:MAG: hypothetical protein HY456_00775 [Parcubacteria group bacterium]|nr:hypothetical protein [Parcubacteria group bacterium]
MPAFDFSGIGVKAKSSDYGFLVDQLDIKRNQLETDGKLSPGDYDILTAEARKIYSHPGLSPAQRSNVLVKISQYSQEKQNSKQKDFNDISRLNRDFKDDVSTNAMMFGNNPSLLLRANSDALKAKLSRLSGSIDLLSNAGDDASAHINEFNQTLGDYNDALQALDDVKNHKPGQKSASNFVAYITTNSKGEITSVDIGKNGSKTGYAETNGLYGGLQVYGKPNTKDNGKNVFVLGDTQFKGSDLLIQDPSVPGSFRSAPLLSTDVSGGKNFGIVNATDVPKDINLATVRSQGSIPSGKFAEGQSGFLYENLGNGKYKKYIGKAAADKRAQITDSDVINIPSVMEKNILPSVEQTVDGSVPFTAPISPSSTPVPTSTQPQAQTPAPAPSGTSRTVSPTTRAPQSAGGIAQKALQVGKGILGYLFGGGE